jgi:hypothetical protein
MGRPRKLDSLTRVVSARIRDDQYGWLLYQAEKRFEGDLSRTMRWVIGQGMVFTSILAAPNPVAELDEMLNPFEPPDPEEEIAEAERELEQWKREQAIKRAQGKKAK